MFTWGEIDSLERQLKASIVALNKKDVSEVTIIEAIDDAALWPKEFDQLAPIAPNTTVENLTVRAPLLICAVEPRS
jgi:aspartate carbamoyltransferase regulatory subunit